MPFQVVIVVETARKPLHFIAKTGKMRTYPQQEEITLRVAQSKRKI